MHHFSCQCIHHLTPRCKLICLISLTGKYIWTIALDTISKDSINVVKSFRYTRVQLLITRLLDTVPQVLPLKKSYFSPCGNAFIWVWDGFTLELDTALKEIPSIVIFYMVLPTYWSMINPVGRLNCDEIPVDNWGGDGAQDNCVNRIENKSSTLVNSDDTSLISQYFYTKSVINWPKLLNSGSILGGVL